MNKNKRDIFDVLYDYLRVSYEKKIILLKIHEVECMQFHFGANMFNHYLFI